MKRFTTVIFTIVISVAFLMIGNIGNAADTKAIVLKVAHADSTDVNLSRKAAMCVVFANEVNTKSKGRIEVQTFGGGALGGERDYVEAIKNGFIQAGIASGVISNFYPPAMVTDTPFLFSSEEIAYEVLDGPFGKKLSADFLAKTGMINLHFGEVGFRNFTTGKKPIHSPADLKGLKIRVQETPFYIAMMKALGAQPTPVAWTETYTALQTGVVDGEENPISSIVNAKLYEVQKCVTLDGHVYGVDWFIMNNKFFKSLPLDLQKVVMDAAKDSCAEERRVSLKLTKDGIKTLKDNGVDVYTPTPQEFAQFRAATQKPCIDWEKTKIDEGLINSCLQAVKDVEAKHKK